MSRLSARGISRDLVFGALVVLVILSASIGNASAQSAGAPVAAAQAPAHPILGVVPARGSLAAQAAAQRPSRPGNNLVYHTGGTVMHTNAVYAIYWQPAGFSVSSGYQSIISGFFQNVALDSGKTSNVYYSDTQYYDGSGSIAYSSSFKQAFVDTNPYPASGCSDSGTSVCLTDAQLQSEIQRVVSLNGWPVGTSTMYFMFTPKNVGSCAGSSCAYTYYCAYHSWIGSGNAVILYANMPYAAWSSSCDSGQHPNGDDADATINVVSHEHNEGITDEQGNAWYDRTGYENGDKCAWNFGTALGKTGTGSYNQVINSTKYYLQQEWSNASTRCVLTGK